MRTVVIVEPRRGPISPYPLVCVIFVSMLFLCAIGLLTRGEFADSVDLPESAMAVAAPRSADLPRIVVNVESNGRLLVAGRQVQSHELEALFLAEKSSSPTNQVEVMIRADRLATYVMVTPVLSAAIRADVSQINFSVRDASGREDVRWIAGTRAVSADGAWNQRVRVLVFYILSLLVLTVSYVGRGSGRRLQSFC